jgi:hypothetical protein
MRCKGFPIDNAFYPIMHKRLSFSHERELRAIFWEQSGEPTAQAYKPQIEAGGLAMQVDLSTLVERVYISPTAPPWFSNLVAAMTKKCGYDFSVGQSVLAAAPLF